MSNNKFNKFPKFNLSSEHIYRNARNNNNIKKRINESVQRTTRFQPDQSNVRKTHLSIGRFFASTIFPKVAVCIGKGSNGSIYKVDTTDPSFLGDMYRSMDNRDKTPLFPHQTPRVVIFKVERCNYKKKNWPEFLQKKLYEAHIHRYLCTHSKTAHIVPPYYFSGTLDNHFVTCMGAVEGRSLTGVFRDFGYTDLEPIYNALEKAVKDLWASGVVHGDLHGKNIIVGKKNGRWTVTLLDFGLAMFIPPKIHEAVLGMIEQGNVQNVWETTGLGKFARSQMAKGGYPFFYENSSSLQFFKRATARAAGAAGPSQPSRGAAGAGPSQPSRGVNKNNSTKNNRNKGPSSKRLKKHHLSLI